MIKQDTYHHGHLREALLGSALDIARRNGPGALGIRDIARHVGVTPAAVYRHFADQQAFLVSVKEAAVAELTATMNSHLQALSAETPSETAALHRVYLIANAYIHFSLDQPGLFQTIWGVGPAKQLDQKNDTAFSLLIAAVREIRPKGTASPAQPTDLSIATTVWATAHGLTTLFQGPLSDLPRAQKQAVIDQTLGMIGYDIKQSSARLH